MRRTSESVSAGLETAFTAVQRRRMEDVPVLNPSIEVEAVGFVPWQEDWLGVLVTPWFMNLMLLPGEPGCWQAVASGTKLSHSLPSGEYEFIAGEEDGIGPFRMCSLYSPMFEFEDQAAAVATAEHVMSFVMRECDEGEPQPAGRTISRRELLRGSLRE